MSEGGEKQANDAPAAEEMDQMMAPAEAPAEEMGMDDESIDEVRDKLKDGAFMCCCCLCHCTEKKLEGLTCCCFFPIKCGILFIGTIILALTLFVFLEIFYELLNDDIHWWYVLVGVILASTLIIASAFTIVFFTDDNDSSRSNMRTACIMVIIGISLVAIWSTVYFVFLYKKDSVVTGNDGVGFVKATRKQEVVITLYIACCIDALFAYFLCVVGQYIEALNTKEEKMEDMMVDMMADEEKKAPSEKAKSEKAASQKSAPKEAEAPAEGAAE